MRRCSHRQKHKTKLAKKIKIQVTGTCMGPVTSSSSLNTEQQINSSCPNIILKIDKLVKVKGLH